MQNGLQLKAGKEMGIPRASKQTSQEMWRSQSHETSKSKIKYIKQIANGAF
jgi:hypothetical protein